MEAVRIAHAGGPDRREIENIAYRVRLPDDGVVMHLGDADPAPVHYADYAAHWGARATDVAFPPYWFFAAPQGQAFLTEQLNARHSVGVHVPVEIPAALTNSGADFFSKPGEERTISLAEQPQKKRAVNGAEP